MVESDNLQVERDKVRVGLIGVDGALTVALGGLLDVFAIANHWCARAGKGERLFEVTIVGTSSDVRTFTGRAVATDATIRSWSGGDVLICTAVAVEPVRAVERNPELVGWLGEQAGRAGVTMASVCTGAFFLAEAGLLSERRATTNPLYGDVFAQRYPDVRLQLSRVLVDEGARITAGTVTAGLNLALYLIERYAGVEVAALTAKSIAVDKNRETQTPYLIPARRLTEGDELAVRAQRWIEAQHADPDLDLARIASAQAVSSRTLQRRFLAATGDRPLDYLRRVRLEVAKRLLETTREPIEQITWQVGYRDPRSFARLFHQYVQLTPSAYRARFGAWVP
jgi:transcriptional regulator GlxA family with amidase domain